jgi:GTP cyclohydrolase II
MSKTGSNSGPPPAKPRAKRRQSGLAGLDLIRVERAGGDLRAGLPVMVQGAEDACLLMAAETMEPGRAEEAVAWAQDNQPWMLLTPNRAAALKIRQYTDGAIAIPIAPDTASLMAMRELADPARDLDRPMRGPFNARRDPLPPVAAPALDLLKHASLLPAGIAWFMTPKHASALVRQIGLLQVSAKDIATYRERTARELEIVAQANLPLAGAERTRVLAFRPKSGAREHLALLIGPASPDHPILVRLHSECLTGDLLGSLKCDCGDQLRGAIAKIGDDPAGGVLLYLAQEGRGIGLVNKLRAYHLQDQGFDTIDANTRLGFEADERAFAVAAEMLRRLGFHKIRLLTNNPDKVEGLRREGIDVVERVAHAFPQNPHNQDYLAVKARRAGHILETP